MGGGEVNALWWWWWWWRERGEHGSGGFELSINKHTHVKGGGGAGH